MRKLSFDEFQNRINEVQKATRIFGDMTDQNITRAFQAYQEILSEEKIPVGIPAESVQGMSGSMFDAVIRPTCPTCGMSMFIQAVPTNPEGIKTLLVCSDPGCYNLESELSVSEWYDLLKELGDDAV